MTMPDKLEYGSDILTALQDRLEKQREEQSIETESL